MAWPHKNFSLNTQSLGWQLNFRFTQIKYSNIHHLTTTFSLPNVHIPAVFITKILDAFPISLSYISRYYNMKTLTVQPYVMQSAQKLEAENLDRIASEAPCKRTCPTPVIPPAVWYSGNGVYNVSSGVIRSMQRTPTPINMYLQTTKPWPSGVTLCSLVDRYRHLKGTCCLHVKNLRLKATSPSTTQVPIYQTIWHILEDII
jgi:hypothetical protein